MRRVGGVWPYSCAVCCPPSSQLNATIIATERYAQYTAASDTVIARRTHNDEGRLLNSLMRTWNRMFPPRVNSSDMVQSPAQAAAAATRQYQKLPPMGTPGDVGMAPMEGRKVAMQSTNSLVKKLVPGAKAKGVGNGPCLPDRSKAQKCHVKVLHAVTWNIAAINNNPFECADPPGGRAAGIPPASAARHQGGRAAWTFGRCRVPVVDSLPSGPLFGIKLRG